MRTEWVISRRRGAAALWLLSGACAALIAADRPAALPAVGERATLRRTSPAPAASLQRTLDNPRPMPQAGQESQMEVLIAQALDQKTQIDLKDVPIRDAIGQLAEKTGIPIVVDPGTVRFLPYGSDTRVTVNVAGQPLNDVLTAILRPIGLKHSVESGKVIVRASRPLYRLAKRSTWQELALLEMLETRPWGDDLFGSLKIQFQDSTSEELQVNREQLRKTAQSVGAGTAAEVLEHATDKFGWTWYPAEDHIVILSKPRQIERQLERHVSLQFKQAALKDVLLSLAQEANVNLKLDPGVLSTASTSLVDGYTLAVENATVRQVLEIIAGQTGLGYVIEPEDVRITSSALTPASASQTVASAEDTAQRTAAVLRSNSFVGQITLPGKDGVTYSFFLRESDLPADVNDLRKARIQEASDRIRAALAATSRPVE